MHLVRSQQRLMPIIRYLVFAGAFVMALLVALDGYLTPLEARSVADDVDRSIIRIRSARALPEKIVFDTTMRSAGSRRPLHSITAFLCSTQTRA